MMTIKLRNHFRAFPFLAAYGLMFFVLAFAIGFNPIAKTIFGGAFLFLFLPCLFLHMEYLLANRGLVVEINGTGIRVTSGGKIIHDVDTDKISRISIYRSANLNSYFVQFPTEYYCYARITTADSKNDIIITSLMASTTFEELGPLWKVKTEIKRALFPSISFPVAI